VRAANSKWQQANLATKIRASNARRRAVKANAPRIKFKADDLLGRIAYFGGKCWICGADYDALDHVKPLSKGGWHCLSNLRPICTPCNTRKLNHWPYPIKAAA
jgi:5-methylcytosine-specific restriction endonuclease McrA